MNFERGTSGADIFGLETMSWTEFPNTLLTGEFPGVLWSVDSF